MRSIKLVVKENLIKKYNITESLKEISLQEDDNIRFEMAVNHLGKLIDEGYDDGGLEKHIDESFSDWFNTIMGDGNTNVQNTTSSPQLNTMLSTVGRSGGNQFKQWMIRQFLGMLGMNKEGPMASGLSMALSEFTLKDLISIFRNRQSCYSHSKDVARGLIDGVIAAIRADSGPNSFIGNFLQNLVSQSLYDAGAFTKIGNAVCDIAFKKRMSLKPSV